MSLTVIKGNKREGFHDNRYRNQMIAKIHIAKKEARICTGCGWIIFWGQCPRCLSISRPITDEDYRDFLYRVTRKKSCKDLSAGELQHILERFYEAGFVPAKRAHIDNLKASKENMIKSAEALAQEVMGANWKRRLNGWVKKVFGVDSMRFLTYNELRAVFGFLHKIEKEGVRR